jgi:hypothetical protein
MLADAGAGDVRRIPPRLGRMYEFEKAERKFTVITGGAAQIESEVRG